MGLIKISNKALRMLVVIESRSHDFDADFIIIEGDVSGIRRELYRPSSDTSSGQTEVNKVVSDINNMFNGAARSLGMVRADHTPSGCSRPRVCHEPHKAWYNQDWENKRKKVTKINTDD